jgi:hypothetical protein
MNQLFRPSKAQDTPRRRATDRDEDAAFGPSQAAVRSVPGNGSEQAFFRLDVRRSLQLHWRLARTVALGFVALGVLYLLAQVFWLKTWPMYMAQSTVYVTPTPGRILPTAAAARAGLMTAIRLSRTSSSR